MERFHRVPRRREPAFSADSKNRKNGSDNEKTVLAARVRAESDANEVYVEGEGYSVYDAEHRVRQGDTPGNPAGLPPRPLYPEGRYSEESARFESRGDAAGI